MIAAIGAVIAAVVMFGLLAWAATLGTNPPPEPPAGRDEDGQERDDRRRAG